MNQKNEQLKIGDKAPTFESESTKGKISLTDYKDKYLVLYFYPKDATPGCTIQANEFVELYDKFQEIDTEVIGISRDSMTSHHNFCKKENIVFPLISDTDGKLCESYKVLQEKVNFGKRYVGIVRSTFIVGKDQTIHKTWYDVKASGHALNVLYAVEALKEMDEIMDE
ncbi:peroxiredoxin [Candidatus Bandiella euplotis]|uniref:thioredoxin-dependent peroxiredoxin n=1 Tax=Candidatus Bandiella euplotis TaxID=1664265 RepID=A0ABZ0UMW1_9RICK|nr:peroxiredoxin [Candidatus Bandiella woodruffii]WPX97478.1 Peroxiredoxin [Candidatus Bandiella woodruffii]